MTSKFKINNKKDIRWKSGFMSIYDISYLDKYSDLADLISDFIKKHLIESESDEFYLMNIDQLEDRVTKITIEAHAYLHYFLILWIEEARLKICQMRKD